ncbi:MAG: putative ABC transport system ATP-binding protein [Gammaproteobacteria bacterium]|jgi:putative ABC transport system ATP-binding protein
MIELIDLSMSYTLEASQLNVLAGVDVSIVDGETVAIIGPSGSGKTTLLLLLAGLELPQAGIIKFDGATLNDMDADTLADIRRDNLGIIFQSFHLVPSLTALGNVSLPLQIAGKNNSQEEARAMLKKIGLAARESHYPSQLSGGEQQRVAIARALVHSPKLVLADEPTGNLDIRTGAKIIEILFALNSDAGSTLILVTHDEAIARRCQRILRLHEGKLIEDKEHVLSN